jgi:hypothetical protein
MASCRDTINVDTKQSLTDNFFGKKYKEVNFSAVLNKLNTIH